MNDEDPGLLNDARPVESGHETTVRGDVPSFSPNVPSCLTNGVTNSGAVSGPSGTVDGRKSYSLVYGLE